MKYEQVFDGEWIEPKPQRGHKMRCCDCSLIHVMALPGQEREGSVPPAARQKGDRRRPSQEKFLTTPKGTTMTDWQPIETAPKNHFPVLLYGEYGMLIGFLDATWEWWPYPAHEPLGYTPTHWAPLPPKP